MSIKNLLTNNNKPDQDLKVDTIEVNTLDIDNLTVDSLTAASAGITSLAGNTLNYNQIQSITNSFDLIGWNHSSQSINFASTQTAILTSQNESVTFTNFSTGHAPNAIVAFTFMYPTISINNTGFQITLDAVGTGSGGGTTLWVPMILNIAVDQMTVVVTHLGSGNSDNTSLRFHILQIPS